MGVVEMLENIQKVVKDYVAKKELENDYISNVVIKDMNLANMDFSHKHFNNCLFINCNFNGSNFSKAYLNGVNLENCNLNNCIFTDSAFVDCKLKMNYINNSNFTNSQLCSMYGESVWYTNHFKNTSFQNANLVDLKLDNSDFRNADFSNANIHSTVFSNCDVRGANLPMNFSFNEVVKSNFQETNLSDVVLNNRQITFRDVKTDKDYIKDIDEHNFERAYFSLRSFDALKPTSNPYIQPINFMKDVIDRHGVDFKTLSEAASAITNSERETPDFTVKLLQATLKTDEYKQAFEAGQSKTAEIAR